MLLTTFNTKNNNSYHKAIWLIDLQYHLTTIELNGKISMKLTPNL